MRFSLFRFLLTCGAAAIFPNATFAAPVAQPSAHAAPTPADLARWQGDGAVHALE
jgi:hypothetical protein